MTAPLADVLAAFGVAADRVGAGWYVFGAQAVAAYGVPRTTADVDITVATPDGGAGALLEALVAAGFTPTISDAEFVAQTRVLPLVHGPSGMPVDAVLSGGGIEDVFLESSRPMKLGGLTVQVISPEHLIATKLLAGRPKDLEDVRGILRQETLALDRVELDRVLVLLESLLGQSDLRPLLAQLEPTSPPAAARSAPDRRRSPRTAGPGRRAPPRSRR